MKLKTFAKTNWPYLFLGFSVLFLVISMFLNKGYFEALSNYNIYWYQLRQVLAILFLYAFGFLFMKVIQHKLDDFMVYLFAFPAGICLWCFMSQFLLLAEFTYRFWRVLFLMCAFIAFCYLIRRLRHIPLIKPALPIGKSAAIIAGIACLVSTGFNYIVLNYDSYFYFADYGKALTLMMSYRDFLTDNTFVLTNIGQFLPLISAFATYFRIDSIVPIQGFMIVNLLVAYAACIYRYVRRYLDAKKSGWYTTLFTALLLSCSVFFLFTNWILSNTWIMFYLFFLFWLGMMEEPDSHDRCLTYGVDVSLLICGFAGAITMLRKDGLIIVCFVFLCYSIKQSKFALKPAEYSSPLAIKATLGASWLRQSLLPFLLLLPSVAYEVYYIYYLRHIVYARTTLAAGSSLLADHQVKPMLLLVALACFYLLVLRIPAEMILKKYLPHAMTVVFVLGLGLVSVMDVGKFIDYIDAWIRNFGGTAFGYSMLGILLLFCLCFIKNTAYDYSLCLSIGYILLILIIYLNKGNWETNVDNSGLRALYQILPIFFCSMAFHCHTLFLSEKTVKR